MIVVVICIIVSLLVGTLVSMWSLEPLQVAAALLRQALGTDVVSPESRWRSEPGLFEERHCKP